MSPDETWRRALVQLQTWKRGSQRAPHKPLLLLLLLARAERGEPARTRFADLQEKLAGLLREFGPPRRSVHPEYPFWHLQNDEIWVVEDAISYPLKTGGKSPTKSTLLVRDAAGEAPRELWKAVERNSELRHELAQTLLDTFWPETIHQRIRSAVGLPDDLMAAGRTLSTRAPRDPTFRDRVLRAYERRCAVCGYDGRLGDTPLGLEAAHIQWHAYAGPDTVGNGLALCSFHHVALDEGAIGITPSLRLCVSQELNGQSMVDELLTRFNGKPIRRPQPGNEQPSEAHLRWHEREVFRGPARGR